MKGLSRLLVLSLICPGSAEAVQAPLRDLIGKSASIEAAVAEEGLRIPEPPEPQDARQYLPDNNKNIGYDWSLYKEPADDPGAALTPPAGSGAPQGETPGAPADRGTTRGLPGNVASFLDIIAFAEGTRDDYNIMFTFARFNSYADHPRQRHCSGSLCSTAAGRYQFLSSTWDPLAKALGLRDFSPASQDKAVMELIRRCGAYQMVADSSNYDSFNAAMAKLNRTWASLPGSPYGQPVRSTAELWTKFNEVRKNYP